MPDTPNISRAAGAYFGVAAGYSREDAGSRKLHYHLLRLTSAGLTQADLRDLGELARLAFEGSDVASQATKIKQRADVSPLGFAIADIVQQAGALGLGATKAAVLGAVLGAYTSLGAGGLAGSVVAIGLDIPGLATLGAIGGAIAILTSTIIDDYMAARSSADSNRSWSDYLQATEI